MILQTKIKLSFPNPTAPKQFIDVTDKTIDVCNMANLNKQHFILKMMFAEMEKSRKTKIKCPIKKVTYFSSFQTSIIDRFQGLAKFENVEVSDDFFPNIYTRTAFKFCIGDLTRFKNSTKRFYLWNATLIGDRFV